MALGLLSSAESSRDLDKTLSSSGFVCSKSSFSYLKGKVLYVIFGSGAETTCPYALVTSNNKVSRKAALNLVFSCILIHQPYMFRLLKS